MQKEERFYGRRKGRALRPNQQIIFNQLYPRYLFNKLNKYDLQSAEEKNIQKDFDALTKNYDKKIVEIGFGGGEHLHWQARHNSNSFFIGCEVFENGIASLLMHLHNEPVENLAFFPEHARYLLRALPENSLDGIYLLFADPWPKKRHANRRFIQQENLILLSKLLKKGAFLRIASDDPTLIEWTRGELKKASHLFDIKEKSWRDEKGNPPATRYEKKAIKAGRIPVFWENIAR